MSKTYRAKDIEVLEGLEPVRKRPGMYIGGTGTPEGLHQLIWEILDNSVDEAMNGYADHIAIKLHKDGQTVTVSDNGRGIPVEKHPRFEKSTLEIILTTLHAGGKFSDKNYTASGGLHGVGSSVVNALSEEMIAQVQRDGKLYTQSYSRGKPTSQVRSQVAKKKRKTGTKITFRADPKIFSKTTFSGKRIREVAMTKAYLNPGLRIEFKDCVEGTECAFCEDDGISAWLMSILKEKKQEPIGGEIFTIEKDEDISLSLAWTENTKEEIISFANGIRTLDGGTHVNGLKSGLVKVLRNYISVHELQPKGVKLSAEDMREGIVAILSVKLPSSRYQIQFQGQTKSRLNNAEVTSLVEAAVRNLETLLNRQTRAGRTIVERIILAAKARAASRAAQSTVRRKIGLSHRLTLPGKLADCSSNKPSESEIFIVEGDSAGGSAKQARDRHFQAVLSLRGKIINSISSSSKKVAENTELGNVVSALGCGCAEGLNLYKLRYDKVIILTDADADGMHIATLLLAFFFKSMLPLVEGGRIFLAKPPLFGIFPQGKNGKTPKRFWAYSEVERDEVISCQKLNNPRIVRYKGLGEMNPDALWETTLNPKTRTLLRVNIKDHAEVSKRLTKLMGSDPTARGDLIRQSAAFLDVDV